MTAALEGGEWSAARPGRTLPPGKTRYPLYRRLDGVLSIKKGKGKVFPLHALCGPEGCWRYNSTLLEDLQHLDAVGVSPTPRLPLPPGKTR